MKKILIIEDELAYVKLLRDKLADKYELLDAQDGKKGLEMAIKEKPDLILLDIRLPVMNGMTALRELRKDAYGKKAKVILLTNVEANDDIVKQVVEDQPVYYFVKTDIKLDDLLEKITKLLAE
jgi:DNA-binding response OmpR family regulator